MKFRSDLISWRWQLPSSSCDMLSPGRGCELAVTTCVPKPPGRSSGSYYQFAHPTTSLTRPTAMCTTLALSAMLLAVDSTCSTTTWLATVRSREIMSLRTLTIFWEREGFSGLDMCSVLVVQSEQHVIYRLMESVGQGGPR